MIEDVTRQGLAAGPGECPERRRLIRLAQLALGFLPQAERVVSEEEPDFRYIRHRKQPGMGLNEGLLRTSTLGHGAHAGRSRRCRGRMLAGGVVRSRSRQVAVISPERADSAGTRMRRVRASRCTARYPRSACPGWWHGWWCRSDGSAGRSAR